MARHDFPHSELFLMFPVPESMENRPYYAGTISEGDSEAFRMACADFRRLELICSGEHYSGCYDSANIREFMKAMPDNPAKRRIPDHKAILRRKIASWGDDWRLVSAIRDNDTFTLHYVRVEDNIICHAAKRKSTVSDNSYAIISVAGGAAGLHPACDVEVNGISCELDTVKATASDISRWFRDNRRPARTYHWNEKHGEYGKGAWSDSNGNPVDRLLCGREEAGQLMHLAIGNSTERLYAWHPEFSCYMEFKREQPESQDAYLAQDFTYHSYHLENGHDDRIDKGLKALIDEINKEV